ncbi:MAG: hypothetical protein EPO26_16455 [Chloroflexota bacterium]|nr:MAG: hypothetical protein EPO26_16455 [Chloroflexota bacterium]
MDLLVPADVASLLVRALGKAGTQEIGGILMGECLSPGRFRVAEVTVQSRGGTLASFLRSLQHALRPLSRFFARTGHDYTRFNYLGEWHSHPLFEPVPSECDLRSMREIVDDPKVGATFVILLIVRLAEQGVLEETATVFVPDQPAFRGSLVIEAA